MDIWEEVEAARKASNNYSNEDPEEVGRRASVYLQKRLEAADSITDPTTVEYADAVAVKYDFAGWAAFRADWHVIGIGFGGHQEDVADEEIQKFIKTNVARVKLVVHDDAERFKLPISRVATAHRRKYIEGRGRRPGPMTRKDILSRTQDWTD